MTGFYRYRKDVKERIRTAYAAEPGVTLDTLVNAGNDRSWGIEMGADIKAALWWNMVLNGSLFRNSFLGGYPGSTDASVLSYAFSMINNFKVGQTTGIQFDANVVGPRLLSQGREDAYCYFDFALRQQLFKSRLNASLVVHDIFRTARYNSIRTSPTLVASTYVRPKYPNITLSLTYSFNSKSQKESTGKVSSGAVFDGKDF